MAAPMEYEATLDHSSPGTVVERMHPKAWDGVYYCGRNLGIGALPDSNGVCGPDSGPQVGVGVEGVCRSVGVVCGWVVCGWLCVGGGWWMGGGWW